MKSAGIATTAKTAADFADLADFNTGTAGYKISLFLSQRETFGIKSYLIQLIVSLSMCLRNSLANPWRL
jgi:hypothetical protein